MSTTGSPPVVFDTPTLGRAVRLGELYDARSGKFLGVQLYPQDKVKEVETDIRHTELTVSLSTTHQQKASLLDINAQLSLDVLGGLVKVSGSASYLNDEKSNTNEYAYALALKMRLKEKRILFAEDDLGRNVLPIVEQDYINTRLATHFVSSVIHGGNYIVNLVARQTEMTKEEKIEGKLQASFDSLKGAVSLSGSVDATIKGEFKDMDDKFDLVVHGDVALDKVPVTPKDVLDTFPEAASLITDGGGVPVSATLQPIPPSLYKAGLIHQINESVVDDVLASFANLDDLRSRFLVLLDSAKRLRDFVPELSRAVRYTAFEYIKEHSDLLHDLAKFLRDYKSGEELDPGSMISKVNKLYNKHVPRNDKVLELSDEEEQPLNGNPETPSKQYPSILVGLEDQLLRIQYLIADIRRVRDSLNPDPVDPKRPDDKKKLVYSPAGHSLYLSSFEDVCRSIRTQSKVPLFFMPPISSIAKHDRLILKYLAIVRKHTRYFEDTVNVAHMLYVENPEDVKHRLDDDELPADQRLPELTAPSIAVAQVDEDGKLTWDHSPPVQPPLSPVHTFALTHNPSKGESGHPALGINGVDSKKAFTIQIHAKEGTDSSKDWLNILVVEDANHDWFFAFRKGYGVHLFHKTLDLKSKAGKIPSSGEEFLGTFVQDMQNQQWIVYLDDNEVAREPFAPEDLFTTIGNLRIAIWDKDCWDGELLGFKAFARALTREEVKHSYLAWKNGQNKGA